MALDLAKLSSITPEIATALKAEGLLDSDKLLAAAGDPKDRTTLAEKLGMEARELLEILNRADLGRLQGIGPVFSDLLEFAGVDTVMELRNRNPENLYAKIMEVAEEHEVKRTPRQEDVSSWVAQAKEMERAISY